VGDKRSAAVDVQGTLSDSAQPARTRPPSPSRPRLLRAAGAAAGVVLCAAIATMATSPARAESTPDSSISFFGESGTPKVANFDDEGDYDLGLRFTSDVKGVVTAIRFYKGPKNIGVHTGSLWSADGHQLATATFADETESGWQTVTFASPVAIEPGTTYVASYFTAAGQYALDSDAFATAGLDKGPLHIAPMGAAYHRYGGFPDQASKHNYWVDIVFKLEQVTESPSPSESASSSAPPSSAPSSAAAAVPSPTPSQSAAAAGGSLPVTGSSTALVVGAGLLFTAVGAALFIVYRRRNSVTFTA
jgi:LPXTG-motif cell wall-anchored protein